MSFRRAADILLVAGVLWGLMLSAALGDYRLGPRDKVKVTVSEWRPATGQVYEWTALSGEFVISAEGRVALPVIGALPAASKTPTELADLISDRVQKVLGLAQRPATAVGVLEYRPIYIVGDVEKPGEYEYRPEMTAFEAISLAGGLFRLAELRRFGREAISAEGDLRVLLSARLAALARLARLRAEISKVENISFPPELLSQTDNKAVAEMMERETSLFASRRKTLQSKLESFSQTGSLLRHEIETLESKLVSVERQLGLAKQELDNITKLVERKLAVSSRQLSLSQTVAQFETTVLDLKLAKLRAQQDIYRTERDASDAVNTRSNEILTELGEAQNELASMAERRVTLERLLQESRVAQSESRLPGSPDQRLNLTVSRKHDGETSDVVIKGTDQLRPGDLLRVGVDLSHLADAPEIAPPLSTRAANAPDVAIR